MAASSENHTVIIGGGIVGASTLYYAAKHPARTPGSRLTLLEASKELAPGASGKAGGFLALDWHASPTESLAELSFRLHRELAEEGEGARRWGYRDVETLQVKFDTSRKGKKCPKDLDWVNPDIVVSSSSMGGKGTTAQVTPKPLVEYLARAAQEEEDVSIRLGTSAIDFIFDSNGKVTGVKVQDDAGRVEEIPCDRVVVTAGPWTGRILKKLSSKPATASSLIQKGSTIDGSRAHSIVVKGARDTTGHCLFTAMRYGDDGRLAAEPEVYPRSDGTVYICGGSDDQPLPPTADEVDFDAAKTARLIQQTAVVSPRVLSEKAGAQIIKQQACYLPGGAFNGPLIDGDPSSGLYVAAGHTCWGITLGPGTGKLMSELLYDGKAISASIHKLRA